MVDDAEAAIAFYTKHFGFSVRSNAAPAFADIVRGPLRILLSGPKSSAGRPMPDGRQPGPGGWNRIHFIVDDIEAEVARLRTAGVRFRGGIVTGPGGKQIVLDDPSGNPIELFQPARRLIGSMLRQPFNPVRGVDMAGTVEAVGENVTLFRPGDEVFGTGRGTFAEYAPSREQRLVAKPSQLTFAQASTMGVAAVTALQGLRDRGELKPGQRALINGAGGGVGTFAVQIAKALGAHVTAATSTRNLDLVRSMDPDEVIDYTQEDVTKRGERYDVVLDVAANRAFSAMRRVLTPSGRLVGSGAAKGSMLAVMWRAIVPLVRERFGNRWLGPVLAGVAPG